MELDFNQFEKCFENTQLKKYTYNSNLDINKIIKIEIELKEDIIKKLKVERINNDRKEVIPLKFLVPCIIKNNQTIVIKGEGNRRKNERGNINIKVIKGG